MSIPPAYAQAAAVVCGLLGLLFGWVRWRHRDPGTGWFSIGFLAICTIFAFGLRAPEGVSATHRGGVVLGTAGVLCIGFGLVNYLGLRGRPAWRWRVGLALPIVAGFVALPFVALPRPAVHALIAISLMTMAAMVWAGARRESGTGLRLVALVLLLHPLFLAAILASGLDVYQLRNLAVIPLALVGMLLFAVALTRARVRVEHLNDTLELRVAQRTTELRDMVIGLESFNRSVSHDLRGPLGGVASLTRLAQAEIGRGETARALTKLEAVAKQADALGVLVHDLLMLARVGDVALAMQRVDLNDCLDQATEQLRLAGQTTETVEAGRLTSVDADAGLLRQVFVNLIGNALKFSRGAQQQKVRVELVSANGRVVVAVRDNGAGFDAGRASDVFEPFKRLHGAAFEGTGLGLAIVRRIVERHGGAVWAESQPGQGASFYVGLPQARP